MTSDAAAEPRLMGIREYARHRAKHKATGATHTAVAKAIEAGRLANSVQVDGRGRKLIDQGKADLEWALTTDPAQQREAEEMRKPEPPPPSAPKQHLIDGSIEDAVPAHDSPENQLASRARVGFSVQRARAAAAKADLTELELQERRGELINAIQVEDEAYRHAVKLRESILALPGRLAPRLAPLKDVEKIKKLLEKELTKALRSLVDRSTDAAHEEDS